MLDKNRRVLLSTAAGALALPHLPAMSADQAYWEFRDPKGRVLILSDATFAAVMVKGLETGFLYSDALLQIEKVVMSYHSVARNVLSRGGLVTLAEGLLVLRDRGRMTLEHASFMVVTNFANALIASYGQEFIEVCLQNRHGVPKEVAKWAAWAIANTQLGAWLLYMQPFILKELQQALGFQEREQAKRNGRELRSFYEIITPPSFKDTFDKYIVKDFKVVKPIRGGSPVWKFNGTTRSIHNEKKTYTISATSKGSQRCSSSPSLQQCKARGDWR